MEDVCRLCLSKHLVDQDIFGDGGVYDKLKVCLPISIAENDNLPKKICVACDDKIKDIYSFFQKAVRVQKQLLILSCKDNHETNNLEFKQLIVKEEPEVESWHLEVTFTTNENSKFTQTDPTDFLVSFNDLETEAKVKLKDELDLSEVRIKIEENDSLENLNNTDEFDHSYSSDDDLTLSSIISKSSDSKNTTKNLERTKIDDGNIVKRSRGRPKGAVKKTNVETQIKKCKKIKKNNSEDKNGDFADKNFYPEGTAEELKKWQCLICFAFSRDRSLLLSHYKEHLLNPSKFLPKVKAESDLTKASDNLEVGRKVPEGAEIAAKKDGKSENDYVFINNPNFGDTPAYQCLKCLKMFLNKRAVVRHLSCHDDTRPFPCNMCGRSYKKAYEILLHGRVHNGFKSLTCKYPSCDYQTVYRGALHNHMKRHEDFGNHKYTCEICNKGFDVLTWYNEHKNVHLGVKPFTCDVCGKSFTYTRYLSSHRRWAHPEAEENLGKQLLHRCTSCTKQFSHIRQLKSHMKAVHDVQKLPGEVSATAVLCDICGKSLTSKEHLKFHRRIHTGEKPHACRTCGKAFVKKCNLKLHERVHSGEKPHVCSHCGKAFSQRSTLVIHERYHSGARPYVCSICNKGFVAQGLLSMHQKTCL